MVEMLYDDGLRCSVADWYFEVSCGRTVYSMVTSKCYNSTPIQSWMVNIYKYITDWDQPLYQFARTAIQTWFKLGLKQQSFIVS